MSFSLSLPEELSDDEKHFSVEKCIDEACNYSSKELTTLQIRNCALFEVLMYLENAKKCDGEYQSHDSWSLTFPFNVSYYFKSI